MASCSTSQNNQIRIQQHQAGFIPRPVRSGCGSRMGKTRPVGLLKAVCLLGVVVIATVPQVRSRGSNSPSACSRTEWGGSTRRGGGSGGHCHGLEPVPDWFPAGEAGGSGWLAVSANHVAASALILVPAECRREGSCDGPPRFASEGAGLFFISLMPRPLPSLSPSVCVCVCVSRPGCTLLSLSCSP